MSVLPMAMALYGLAGYNNFKANQRERARQDEEDAFKREERARTRESWKAEDKLKTDVADAYAPRTTMSGTVTDTEQGKYFSSSPENAAVMQDTLSAEAELRGATAPVQQAGYAITGKMSKGHQIASGQAPAEFQDTDKDRFQRALEAYRANGQFEKAASMEKGVLELESMRIGLKTEEFDFAQKLFNLKVEQYLSDPQGWEWGLARALSDTNVSGLNGLTFTPKKSDDGKSIVLEGRDQSGKVVVEKAYPSGDQGLLKVREELTRVDPEEKIRYLNERFKAEQERADKDREYGVKLAELEIKAQEAKSKDELRASRGGGSGGGGSGAAGSGSGGTEVSFDPYEGFDPKNAQAEATANVDALIANSRKPVTAQERARLISEQVFALSNAYAHQNANRVREAAFLGDARSATTPEQIEAVRQKALQLGFTEQQMAALDPRFAPKVDPKQEPQKPQGSGPMERMFGGSKPPQPAYTPPAGSPAARVLENRAKAAAALKQEQDAMVQAARSAARAALASKDIAAASKAQDMPGFRMLTSQEKLAVRGLVFGR